MNIYEKREVHQTYFKKNNFLFLFQMVHFLTHYADKIESVHFSDQFSGPKIMQEYV